MNYEKFLTNEEKDFKGRFLEEIWNFSDQEIESTHDFIQIVFPLNKASRSVFHGHYLDSANLIKNIKQNTKIKENIIKSSEWFLSFLKRNNYWNRKHNHNHLRITRVIESLRLLVSDKEANKFYQSVLELVESNNVINKITLDFWKNS